MIVAKLLAWSSVACIAFGWAVPWLHDLPFDGFFRFGAAWAIGSLLSLVAYSMGGTTRKLAMWALAGNILSFPVCFLFVALFVFSPH
jgi:hypothetical protein